VAKVQANLRAKDGTAAVTRRVPEARATVGVTAVLSKISLTR
jgi:hypothetical protein